MESIEIKDGKHKGELGVIVDTNPFNGVRKVLTLEGDCHYFDKDGKEVCQCCQGTKQVRTIFGVIRCQWCK